MGISLNKIKIQGVLPGSPNPLPLFHSLEREKPGAYDGTFLEEDKALFAYETGFRVLPYMMQDSYSRDRKELELRVIDLENDKLRARFLPEFGGRLISLFDKGKNRELLFSNPVFQPANLAIRDAWFSGGIEWNISQLGHSYLTCEPVFFARLDDGEGNPFLRMYEFERNRRVFFSIDFHLPPEAEYLAAHVRIVNDNEEPVPMYWWTNTALKEEPDVRVFSETDQVIYIKPESNTTEGNTHCFGRGSIADLPSLPGKDPSYPRNFDFSSEYFFQNPPEAESHWEAAVYRDGHMFYDRSTGPLRYRKMFCWGTHRGGRNWCDFLSRKGEGNYIEIQAGIAPTQMHGLVMPGNTTWQFTQIFGSAEMEASEVRKDWFSSRQSVRTRLDEVIPAELVEKLDGKFRKVSRDNPLEILFRGAGWGALESEFRSVREKGRPVPQGFLFPGDTPGEDQLVWLELLRKGIWNTSLQKPGSPSWQTDPRWKTLLAQCRTAGEPSPWPLIHRGVIAYEEGNREEAVVLWQDSLEVLPTALAWRNIAVALKDWNRGEQALEAMRRAVGLEDRSIRKYLVREYLSMLIDGEFYDEAWKYYRTLPLSESLDERIMIPAAEAAFHRDERVFLEKVFAHPFANIREGETRLADLWYAWQARLAAEKEGGDAALLLAEIRRTMSPPSNIDFTMAERD